MKILIVSAAYPPDVKGGGEHSTQIISEALASRGHQVDVLTLSNETISESINQVNVFRTQSPNIFWNFTPKKQPLVKKVLWHILDNFNPRAFKLAKNHIKKISPDIVLTSTIENFGPEVWRAAKHLNIPVVHVLRSYYVHCFKGTCFKNNKNCAAQCVECNLMTLGRRVAAKDVNGLIGISDFILNKNKEYFPNASYKKIFNPVIFSEQRPKSVNNKEIRFGFLGRLEPEKGIELLLKDFYQLPDHFKLLIGGAGNPDYEAFLKNKYKKSNIEFLGWIKAQELYTKIDFLILPAQWHEPFGRVVVEAYSYGLPVIASYRGGLTELVVDGKSGYLFEPTSPGALLETCLKAEKSIENYNEMSMYSLMLCNQFKAEKIAIDYEDFLVDVISKAKVT